MDANRLKVIAYNAIVMWQEDALYDYSKDNFQDRVMEQLDITAEEYKEIMED